MTNSPKIQLDNVHARISSAEINSILELSQALTCFEKVEKYVSSYLELGWLLKVVIPQLDIPLDVDFRQGREVWMQHLTTLALKGIHPALMVCTGAASNLMVLGVRGNHSEKALILGRDWRSGCVIQIGGDLEQHFYTWPGSLSLSTTQNLENFDIMISGEGGKIVLPPSLIPGSEESTRWVAAPWENPPHPPSPRLMEFLETHYPQPQHNEKIEPDIPSWEEIFPHLAKQNRLLQALLTPAADPADYYQLLIKEARAAGLQDQRLILGVLWHAPLGTARHELKSLPWLQELITEKPPAAISENPPLQKQLTDLLHKLSEMLAELNTENHAERQNSLNQLPPTPDVSLQVLSGHNSLLTFLKNHVSAAGSEKNPAAIPAMAANRENPFRRFVHATDCPPGEILVDRHTYEALIYELGRLHALQKCNSQIIREAKLSKAKMASQQQEEINHLRQMTLKKKFRKWW